MAAGVSSLVIAAVLAPIALIEYQRRISARDGAEAFIDKIIGQDRALEVAADRYATAIDAFGEYSLKTEMRRQALYIEQADNLITNEERIKADAAISDELAGQQAKIDDLRVKYEVQADQFNLWRAGAALEGCRRYPSRNVEISAAFAKAAAHIARFNQDLANQSLAFAVAGTLRQYQLRVAFLSYRAGKINETEFRERLKNAVDVTVAEKNLPHLMLTELRALIPLLETESPRVL
jgi:hypothetical protein